MNKRKKLLIAIFIIYTIDIICFLGLVLMNADGGCKNNKSYLELEREVREFNQEFVVYAGNQRGTAIRGLISKAEAAVEYSKVQMFIQYDGVLYDLKDQNNYEIIISRIETSSKYLVSFERSNNERINKIIIENIDSN